jgi:predicted nucleic acid-binding protein
MEEYGVSHGLRAGDAIIAATAAENGVILCTGDARHFRPIRDLRTNVFRP